MPHALRAARDGRGEESMSELIDNRAYRIRTLKEIIRHLHQGVAPEVAREQEQGVGVVSAQGRVQVWAVV